VGPLYSMPESGRSQSSASNRTLLSKENNVLLAEKAPVPLSDVPIKTAAEAAKDPSDASPKDPPRRSFGLRAFDVLVYPIITNTGVFGLSVLATYLTSRGGQRNAAGELVYGKLGEFFQKRGDWMIEKFKGMGMTHDQADMSKMVFFSFADGSLLAPVVKMLEDRRGDIGHAIDKQFGTRPEDEGAYKTEPKQTWGSVFGGRLLTVLVVVPTAVALDKAGLNKVLFSDPGLKVGKMIAEKPELAKHFGGLDIPELSKISFFEMFYTSVCTAGLYVISRFLAPQPSDIPAALPVAAPESVIPPKPTQIEIVGPQEASRRDAAIDLPQQRIHGPAHAAHERVQPAIPHQHAPHGA